VVHCIPHRWENAWGKQPLSGYVTTTITQGLPITSHTSKAVLYDLRVDQIDNIDLRIRVRARRDRYRYLRHDGWVIRGYDGSPRWREPADSAASPPFRYRRFHIEMAKHSHKLPVAPRLKLTTHQVAMFTQTQRESLLLICQTQRQPTSPARLHTRRHPRCTLSTKRKHFKFTLSLVTLRCCALGKFWQQLIYGKALVLKTAGSKTLRSCGDLVI